MLFKIGEFYADKIFIPIDRSIVSIHNKYLNYKAVHYSLFVVNLVFYVISYFILYLCGMKID